MGNDHEESDRIILAVSLILFCGVIGMLGFTLGSSSMQTQMEKQAVLYGHAEYGEYNQFKWKPKCEEKRP